PHGAVLFVRRAEWAFPLRYEQVVRHRRRDVDVIVLNLLGRPWYRDQVGRLLRRRIPTGAGFPVGAELAKALLGSRPVWLDLAASVEMRQRVGFRQLGLVAEVHPSPDLTAAPVNEQLDLLDHRYHMGGLLTDPARLRFPNRSILKAYGIARLQVAGQLVAARRT